MQSQEKIKSTDYPKASVDSCTLEISQESQEKHWLLSVLLSHLLSLWLEEEE